MVSDHVHQQLKVFSTTKVNYSINSFLRRLWHQSFRIIIPAATAKMAPGSWGAANEGEKKEIVNVSSKVARL